MIEPLKHLWRYHKLSAFMFSTLAAFTITLGLFAVESIRRHLVLSDSMLTGLILIMFALIVCNFWVHAINAIAKDEAKQEKQQQ